MSSVKYQPHIDGLRAIAVISVLVFHINPEWLPGGFIGVDIFFVISGFLITSIINKEISKNSFSFKAFYQRRIKRILPVYFSVSFFVLILGYFIYFPKDYVDLAASAASSTLFLSNFYFWSEANYFSQSILLKPLAHTWSLAVEEQFYIFWPILMMTFAVFFRKAAKLIVIVIIFFVSLLCSYFLSISHPDFAYYSLFTRVDELMVGAIFSMYGKQIAPIAKNLSLPSLLVIVISFFQIDKSTIFPSYVVLFPCIATGILLINNNKSNLLNRLLSVKPMIYLGLLSYSLYMWHWPILSFVRYIFVDVSTTVSFFAIVSIFATSILSRKFIELPSIKSQLSFSKSLTRFFIFPALILISTSAIIIQSGGAKWRYNAPQSQYFKSISNVSKSCLRSTPIENSLVECVFTPSNANEKTVNVLVWGDSHTNHLIEAVKDIYEPLDLRMEIVAFSGCPSIYGIYRINRSYSVKCYEHNSLVLKRIVNKEFDLVIMSSNWANYQRGPHLADDIDRSKSVKNSERALYENLNKTLSILNDLEQPMLFVDPVPNFFPEPTRCESIKITFNPQLQCHISHLDVMKKRKDLYDFKAKVIEPSQYFSWISFVDLFCEKNGKCTSVKDGKSMYISYTHMSLSGSKYLANKLKSELQKVTKNSKKQL